MVFREYVGEELITPFISYLDMETKYSIEIGDLGHQTDHKTPKKIQFFHEYGDDLDNARLFQLLLRRRKVELISDGKKLFEIKVI